MHLILLTILFFAIVAIAIYVGTELIPKWIFLRRHKVHTDAFEQFDITDPTDKPDQ